MRSFGNGQTKRKSGIARNWGDIWDGTENNMFRKRRILLRRGIRKRQQRKVIAAYEKLVAAGDVVAMLDFGEIFEN